MSKEIEITSEALEEMGFKRSGIGAIYRYEVENRLPVEVYMGQNTTVIEYGEPGWEMDHEVYVKTLPELRKFMRFMFGIKEFPRRELSTITDEELYKLMCICHNDNALPKSEMEIAKRFDIVVWIKSYAGMELSNFNITLHGAWAEEYPPVPFSAFRYLEDVCDFHLPEAAHNAN